MIRYVFSDQPLTIKSAAKANAQRIGEELATIAAANGGKLTPKAVVEKAASPKSALHRHLEWDNEAAAHAYRLEQARELIRVVRVEQDDGEPVRAFFSINEGGTAYRTLSEVRQSPNLQEIVLKQALRDLRAFETRYREMSDVCDLVRQAQRKVGAKLKAAEEQRVAA